MTHPIQGSRQGQAAAGAGISEQAQLPDLRLKIAQCTTAPTGGEVRVWAVLMDIDDSGSMVADEVSRDVA